MIEAPFSPSTASRPLGRAPASMHAGLGPAVLVRRGERLPHADERVRDQPLGRPLQGNLASTYQKLGRREEAMLLRRDVYSGNLKLLGAEHFDTLREAHNYATSLFGLERFEEGKALLRRTIPVARRVLGEVHDLALTMRWLYAAALCEDPGATLDDVREAVTTLEDAERIARRVLGGAHPTTVGMETTLRKARAALRARETPSGSAA